ncbi:LptF/LptG family permease [candidate division WOR-3 bacterium]|nr:LptF/LptG family permease [candidate division WOR-3 bacterium]
MIKIIDRYFLREFTPPFVFSVFSLTFILLMDQLFRLIDLFVRKGLPALIVGEILIYTLPLIVSYTAPMAVLVAIVVTFGRFSHDNEILALKTSGLTFVSIMRTPVIVIGLFTIGLIFFNAQLLPEANHRLRNLMLDVSRKRPAIRLPEGVFTDDFPGYTVYIGQKDEGRSKVFDITIYDTRNNLMMTAPHGDLKDFEEEGILQFVLYDGELHQLIDNDKYQRTHFTKQIINMEISTDVIHEERTYRNQNELNVQGLLRQIKETEKEVQQLSIEIQEAGLAGIEAFVFQDMGRLSTIRFKIDRQLNTLTGKARKIARLKTELNKKFSLAVACLFFVIMGAPLGYLFKKSGIAGIIIGVLLFSLYYILVIVGEEFADRRGFSPFWAMWIPNIILLCSGIYLLLLAEYERSPLKKVFR